MCELGLESSIVVKLFLTFYFPFTDYLAVADAGRRVNGTVARKNNWKSYLLKVISKIQMSEQGQEINTEKFNLVKLIEEEIYTRNPLSDYVRKDSNQILLLLILFNS